MFETDISRVTDKDVNFKRNRDQWRKVLGTFELIKDKASVSTGKLGKKSIGYKKNRRRTRRTTTSEKRKTLQTILPSNSINSINKVDLFDSNTIDSAIVWSSSTEESDSGLGIAISKKRVELAKCKKIDISRCDSKHYNLEVNISCSSSNKSGNEENQSSIQKGVAWRRKKYFKRKLYDFEINWSSSNESGNEGNTTQKNRLYEDSLCELDSFVKEIEKDLRRTKKLKQQSTIKKGGYADSFRKAVHKAKADTGFLDYEQRTEIICGCKGVIIERNASYGSYLAKVQIEGCSNSYILLGKNMQSSNVGSALICFLDESNCYTIKESNVFVQPNKVIRA